MDMKGLSQWDIAIGGRDGTWDREKRLLQVEKKRGQKGPRKCCEEKGQLKKN
jgi:hypothetical protein